MGSDDGVAAAGHRISPKRPGGIALKSMPLKACGHGMPGLKFVPAHGEVELDLMDDSAGAGMS